MRRYKLPDAIWGQKVNHLGDSRYIFVGNGGEYFRRRPPPLGVRGWLDFNTILFYRDRSSIIIITILPL